MEKDQTFKDEESYYKQLVASGGLTFNFVPEGANRSVSVIGIKAYLGAPSAEEPDRPRKSAKARKKP